MQDPIRHIVLGTSLTEAADSAVRAGLEIARRAGAQLHLVHAYALPVTYMGEPGTSLAMSLTELPVENLYREQLAAQLARVGGDPQLAASATIEVGTPQRVILEAARTFGADLIVVGPHEGSPRLAALLGSTADRILREAWVPVWVVRGQQFNWPEKVLAPVDLSPLSHESLTRGLELLHTGGTACQVEALFVLSEVDRRGSVHFSPEQVDRFANDELKRFVGGLNPPPAVHVQARLAVGLPREQVLADLSQHPVDLMILGTHGRSGFERFLLGSVAAVLVRDAACSVLVVPPLAARKATPGAKARQDLALVEALGPMV